jgi:hypothetical protein
MFTWTATPIGGWKRVEDKEASRIPTPQTSRWESECYKEHDATQASKQYRKYSDDIDVFHERIELLERVFIRRASSLCVPARNTPREAAKGGTVLTYTFLLRLDGMRCNRRNAETIQISCRYSRAMLNFLGCRSANGDARTGSTYLNVYIVLWSMQDLHLQYPISTRRLHTSPKRR